MQPGDPTSEELDARKRQIPAFFRRLLGAEDEDKLASNMINRDKVLTLLENETKGALKAAKRA